MIFINNKTGELYELLILSLSDENSQSFTSDGRQAFRIGEITLFGTTPPRMCTMINFNKEFSFIGFI